MASLPLLSLASSISGCLLPSPRSLAPPPRVAARSPPPLASASLCFHYKELHIATGHSSARELTPAQEISLHDITAQVEELVRESGVQEGTLHCVSRHTTTALTINEMESLLQDDIRTWLFGLAPPDVRFPIPSVQSPVGATSPTYAHNDLHRRPASEEDRQRIDKNWMSQGKGTLEEFMAQEPINAHSHLLSILLGPSVSIPITKGQLCIGQWQSLILVDCDGPRERTVGAQVVGVRSD